MLTTATGTPDVRQRRDGRARTKIRVGHLIHTMAHGGIETALINWVLTMDRDQFEIHLFCFANPGGTENAFVEAASRVGLTVHRIPWSRRKSVWRAAKVMAGLAR